MRYLTLAAIALLAATLPAHAQQPSATDRIIEEDIRIRLPLLPCTVPQAAVRIAESLPTPLGLELVPEPCGENGKKPPDKQDEVVLTGMSVSRAFDRLVELDERYVWSEVDGVLVVRPGVTWFDPNHFLNRKIPAFSVKDGRMWAAMDAVHLALGGARGPADEVWPASTPQSDRRFTVSLGTTTVLNALNAVVRAHGSLRWRVEYCKPQALFEYAMLRLRTFDGGGIGRHSATRRDDGTWSDACGSTNSNPGGPTAYRLLPTGSYRYTARMKSILAAIVTAVLVMGMVQTQGQQLQKITLNYPTRSGASWPLFIAKEGGYYEKQGLDVTLVFAGHPAGIAMVVSDQAQMSSYNLESVMQASSRGDAPFAVVGASLNKAYFALMTRKDVASVKDLKGKTFAVSQIGDPPYNYTSAFLRKFGMSPRDVQWIAAGADATGRAAALSAGRADATLLTPPAYFRLEEAGFKSLGNLADHDDIFAATTYLMKKTAIAASPRLPEQLIKAQAEAIKRFYDDKAFAVKAYQAYDKQTNADVERLYDGYAKANVLERVPYVLAPALQAVIDQQSDAKLLAQMKAFDFRTVIDNGVVARLVKEGFFEKLFGPGVKAEEERKAKLAFR